MWGAKVHQRRDLIETLMQTMILSGQNQNVAEDQESLAKIVWPAAKFDVVWYIIKNHPLEDTPQ